MRFIRTCVYKLNKNIMKKITLFITLVFFLAGLGYAQSGCPSITLPYMENFDSYNTGQLPPCWSQPVAYQFSGNL
jgi:hypothetical protein